MPFDQHSLKGHRQAVDQLGIVGSRGEGIQETDRFRNHMAPSEVRPLLGEHIWSTATRLANIRNPWDSFVSRVWFWSKIGRFELSSQGHLTPYDIARALEGWGRAKVESEVLGSELGFRAHCIVRFENLKEDLAAICSGLGIPHDVGDLAPSYTSERPTSTRDYRSLFTNSTRRQIKQHYVDWIEFGQYQF